MRELVDYKGTITDDFEKRWKRVKDKQTPFGVPSSLEMKVPSADKVFSKPASMSSGSSDAPRTDVDSEIAKLKDQISARSHRKEQAEFAKMPGPRPLPEGYNVF